MLNELVQSCKDMMSETINEIHTVIPGKIVSYDPEKNLAKILPTGKYRKPDKTTIDYPQVSDVPVYLIQGSGQDATIVYPIKPDDGCLLFFSEQALDYWMTGAESENDLRFDLTNAIAVVGMCVKPNKYIKKACDENAIIIDKEDDTRITMKKDFIEMKRDPNKIIISKDKVDITGNVYIHGNVYVDNDVFGESRVSLVNHIHGGVMPGSGNTSNPT